MDAPRNAAAAADHAALEAAADWYARLCASDTEAQRAEWSRWLDARPEHRHAWTLIEAVSRRFAPLRHEGERDAAVNAARVAAGPARTGRRRALGSLAALGGAGLAGWFAWHDTSLPERIAAWRADYRTGVGERREIVLADDTHIWLDTGTALDVRYDDTRRLIALKAGEILIDTGKDARQRPFHVATRYGDLQALGTRFSVRDDADGTLLTVFGGAVRIRNTAGAEAIVPANRQQRFDALRIDASAPADLAREAWSRGVLIADDMTLAAFAAELDRYRHGYLSVSPEVAALRVVGRYPLDRPAQILAMVSQDLPIAVRHPLPWWTTIGPR